MAYFYDVKYTVKPGKRAEFIAALAKLGVGANSRREEGNRKYEYIVPTVEKDTLILHEIWETLDFQKAHCQTEVFKELIALKAEFVDDTAITVTEIDDASALNE